MPAGDRSFASWDPQIADIVADVGGLLDTQGTGIPVLASGGVRHQLEVARRAFTATARTGMPR